MNTPFRTHPLPLKAGYYTLEAVARLKGFMLHGEVSVPEGYEAITDGLIWNIIKI